jgi:predicted GIY-YIG superfamily endonuclease
MDLVGRRFGRYVVLERAQTVFYSRSGGRATRWLVRCGDCGGEGVVSAGHLRSGSVDPCGCKTFADIVNEPHGVYRFYSVVGELLYVGIAHDFARRLSQHRAEARNGEKAHDWFRHVDHSKTVVVAVKDRATAKRLETILILTREPTFNRDENPHWSVIDEMESAFAAEREASA